MKFPIRGYWHSFFSWFNALQHCFCFLYSYGLLVKERIWRASPHRVGGNRKRYQQSTNADQKSIEIVFSIAICRQCGDKWQPKTLFLTIFDLRSSIVLAFSIAAYPVWYSFPYKLQPFPHFWNVLNFSSIQKFVFDDTYTKILRWCVHLLLIVWLNSKLFLYSAKDILSGLRGQMSV